MTPVGDVLAVFNAGSTSLKFGAYAPTDGGLPTLRCRGRIDSLQDHPHFVVTRPDGGPWATHVWGDGHAIDHTAALRFVMDWIEANLAGAKVVGAGHRILLGGDRHEAPVRLDADVLDYLGGLVAMEPSHQAANLSGARAFAEAFPGIPQVACFDTAFHRSMPDIAQTYALPQAVRDLGVRHWGFHGLSYEYISRRIPAVDPTARRVIAAHLGGGASLCALMDGRSVETTMGFGALSGLPMETRCGDLPPEALFYLLRHKRFDAQSLETMLYEESGLLGLSGVSGDMRVLQDSRDPRAAAAIDYFAYAMAKYVGAYVGVLGGLDALIFTAGIGENSPPVRAALCERLGWLGVVLDTAANAAGGPRISTDDSTVAVWVIPTDEELMIAQHTEAVLAPARDTVAKATR